MRFLLIFALVAVCCGHSFDPYPDLYETDYLKRADDEFSPKNTENFRLTDDIWPSYYLLMITPYIGTQKHFDGKVSIDFTVKQSLKKIILNQEDISIKKYNLQIISPEEEGSTVIELANCLNVNQYQKLECTLKSDTLEPGFTYQLVLEYSGLVHDDMRGFYESYYKDDENSKKLLGTTHFGQQTRRLMPCFDEPAFKAEFELHIGRNPQTHPISISNANLYETEELNETFVIDRYKPTAVISTYLLAFVISDFANVTDHDRENHTFAIYARPNAIDQVSFAFQLGPKLIREFDAWNGISYYEFEGVEKMDIAAIPDFSAGAMENLGMLLHRETNLLVDDDHTNTLQKQGIALVISHEIAHMWFGDLVTCHWFEAIWLNEGFATYFEFIALDPVHKDWKVLDNFVVSTMQNALSADAQRSSHPLTNPGVNSYPEIRTLFSTITYDKGGSILRMMHNIMEPGSFQKAIQDYLQRYKYSIATPEDLFVELEKQDPYVSPREIFNSYSVQAGYPLLMVRQDGDFLKVTQRRFLIDEIDHNITSRWTIPVTVAKSKLDFSDKRAHLSIFEAHDDEHIIPFYKNTTSLDYYMLNMQAVGFYRINYEEHNWQAIAKALKSENHGDIHVLNRAQIIDDLFNLARAGYLSYDFILNIVDYVIDEKEYLPWYAMLNGLSYLMQRIPDENYKTETFNFVKRLLSNIYDHLDWKSGDDHQDKLNRINILNWACKYGNEKCVERAKTEFENAMEKKVNIDPDWKPAVYCTGLREKAGNWDTLWEKYTTTNYATEQAMILTALGCTKDENELHTFLEKILTDDIRLQDKSSAYNRAYSGNLENVDFVFNYVTANYEEWSKVMDLASTLGDLANRFTNQEQVEKLQKFVDDTNLSESVKTRLKSAIERSKKNLEWDSKRLKEIKSYFNPDQGGKGHVEVLSGVVICLAITVFALF
ncbi:membrane alanyl aminopeptidase-like [Culicoides brevitarsis]|uniref:membrane alanyl aminopeptidase-like n=1 Tax=Culicoides brevitarsis TaxID=469753 RepID=UPI00307B611B